MDSNISGRGLISGYQPTLWIPRGQRSYISITGPSEGSWDSVQRHYSQQNSRKSWYGFGTYLRGTTVLISLLEPPSEMHVLPRFQAGRRKFR